MVADVVQPRTYKWGENDNTQVTSKKESYKLHHGAPFTVRIEW